MIHQYSKWQISLFILWIALLLHFTRLSAPRSVVFDEVHFGKFTTAYCCSGENFFDIHPPHAKLMIAGAAKMGGYDGNFDFDRIAEPYNDAPIFWFRFFPALWGTFLPVAFFWLLNSMGVSLIACTFGALALAFDNAFLVQTRIIALDGQLLLSIICSLCFFLIAKKESQIIRKNLFLVLAGFFSGLSVATKFTGLVSPLLLCFLTLLELWKNLKIRPMLTAIKNLFVMTVSGVAVYLAGWWLHFKLLPFPGRGDAFYATTGKFFHDLVNLHEVMLARNAGITAKHGDASVWWQWPLMYKPIYYWQGPDADIYFVGNPVIWWGSTLLFLAVIGRFIYRLPNFKKMNSTDLWMGFCILAFSVSYLPFVPITRPLFLYHYMTPLLFAMTASILWIDTIQDEIRKRYVCAISMLVILVGFGAYSAMTFGWSMTRPWAAWIINHSHKFN